VKTTPTPATPGAKGFNERLRPGEASELLTAGSTSVFTSRRSATDRAETLLSAIRKGR
jgi:hypothetical protein